ncbi:uncharacterized protein METZ01_LOCUS186227, partial [marine metagenome]
RILIYLGKVDLSGCPGIATMPHLGCQRCKGIVEQSAEQHLLLLQYFFLGPSLIPPGLHSHLQKQSGQP